jgi:hypothetical protein
MLSLRKGSVRNMVALMLLLLVITTIQDRHPFQSLLYISDNNGSKAIRMTAETITAAVASGTSGVTTLMYSPSIAATSTAMLRTESANT